MTRRPAPLLAALVAAACHGEAAEAGRAEVGRVAHAVEDLRNAPSRDKGPFLHALENTACTNADACALRKACVDAYALHLRALEAVAAVRHATQAPDAGKAAAMAELLARSEQDLASAEKLAKGCADLEADLRRKHGL